MSEQPEVQSEVGREARDDRRNYADPHSAARSSLIGTAGPEDRDPVDDLATEPPEAETVSPDDQESGTSGTSRSA